MARHRQPHRARFVRPSAARLEPLEDRRLFDATLYAIIGGKLDTLDAATGAVTVGPTLDTGGSQTTLPPNLLAEGPAGQLYGNYAATNGLGVAEPGDVTTIDPTTGGVGNGFDLDPLGIPAFSPDGTLYFLYSEYDTYSYITETSTEQTPAHLGTATPTGATTTVGQLGTGHGTYSGFAFDGPDDAFALLDSDVGPELLHVNPQTAAITTVGPTGLVSTEADLAFGSDGTLYSLAYAADGSLQVASLNPSTGKGTVVSTVSLPSGQYGISDITSAPLAAAVSGGITTSPTPTPTPTPSPTPTSTSVLTVAAAKSTVPTAVVAGTKVKGTVTVSVDNASGTALKGTSTIDLYAVTAGQAATAGTLVGTAKHGGSLAGGRSANVAVAVKPTALPAGSYTLVAVVTDPTGGTSTAATGPTVTVAAAHVDLSATLSATPAAVTPGKVLSLTLVVTNSGNVNSTGPATVAVYLSADGAALSIPVTTAKVAATVRAGKSATVRLRVKVPAAAAAMNLYPLAVFTQGTATPATAVATSTVAVG